MSPSRSYTQVNVRLPHTYCTHRARGSIYHHTLQPSYLLNQDYDGDISGVPSFRVTGEVGEGPHSTWIQTCVSVWRYRPPQVPLMWSSPVIPASRPGARSSAFMTLTWPHRVPTRRAAPSHWGSSTLSSRTRLPSGSPTSLRVSVTPWQLYTISLICQVCQIALL